MSAEAIAGYLPIQVGEARGFAHAAAAPWLEATLRDYGTLREWARRRGTVMLAAGRAAVWLVAAPVAGPGGAERWVCRRYVRGGLAGPLLGDRHLRVGQRRTLVELHASCAARARGVPTPAVVVGAEYPAGAFYRADLMTELLPDTWPIAEALLSPWPSATRSSALLSAGRLVRSLEVAGVQHADLNAGNVLVSRSGVEQRAWVVDLDRCRVTAPGGPPLGPSMRRRLERSLAKVGLRHGRPLSDAEWGALREGYGREP